MSGYQAVLKRQPRNPDALYLFGLVMYRQGKVRQAIDQVMQAIDFAPEHVLAHASLAQIYQDQSDHKRAVLYFRRATQLDPTIPGLFNGLGLSLASLGKEQAALKAFIRALELKPDILEVLNNLGNLQRTLGNLDEAEKCYLHCLEIQADFVQALNNLGVLYQQQQKPMRAIKHFEAAIGIKSDYAEAHNNLGAALNDQGETDCALDHFLQAIEINPSFSEAYINAGMAQQNLGQHVSARAVLDHAIQIEPENLTARWARCVSELESVYATTEAIDVARRGYETRLNDLLSRVDLDDPRQSMWAVAATSSMQPFLLPYQGQDDRKLQSIYGDFICKGMQPPESAQLPSTRKPGPLRVGIVSAFFYNHSNWKVPIQGWLRYLAGQFEVIVYYTGARQDRVTAEAKALSARFHSGLSAQQFSVAIQEDDIDFLIYPELGMHPVTTWLAIQRLAKIQCASWGHPVTTGLPSIDYFLSSDLMEPEGAQSHYREKLIRLPGLSFSWTLPDYDEAKTKTPCREQFGLGRDEIICLCVQNLSKYLPRHDTMLVGIASQVPQSRMVFIEGAKNTTSLFKNRLRACFEHARLDFNKQVLFLPRLNRDEYHALNLIADIFLDTSQWSGCNSTLEALNCNLPVVTLPGQWMRGRHSYAFYRKMQYEALIARDEKHYIELAVHLAKDAAWREEQRQKISRVKFRLVEDDEPVCALAEMISGLVEQ